LKRLAVVVLDPCGDIPQADPRMPGSVGQGSIDGSRGWRELH